MVDERAEPIAALVDSFGAAIRARVDHGSRGRGERNTVLHVDDIRGCDRRVFTADSG